LCEFKVDLSALIKRLKEELEEQYWGYRSTYVPRYFGEAAKKGKWGLLRRKKAGKAMARAGLSDLIEHVLEPLKKAGTSEESQRKALSEFKSRLRESTAFLNREINRLRRMRKACLRRGNTSKAKVLGQAIAEGIKLRRYLLSLLREAEAETPVRAEH